MTEIGTPATGSIDTADVFAAARWFDGLWNSTARAVSPEEVEWQCGTWGSGRGGGDWLETAIFGVVAQVFGLKSWRDYEGRDELVVLVPLALFPQIVALVDRLGDEPECWPWFGEDAEDREIDLAAEVLGMSPSALADDTDLLEVLRIA